MAEADCSLAGIEKAVQVSITATCKFVSENCVEYETINLFYYRHCVLGNQRIESSLMFGVTVVSYFQ